MKKYSEFTREELLKERDALVEKYNEYKEAGLKLDLSRGKPNSDQLDISLPLLSEARPREKCFSENGVDCRNYGVLDGIPEMKRLFADMLGIKEEYIAVGGNSSLQLMYDTITRAMLFGVLGSERPWCQETQRKWICVTPGYDRHFKMTEVLGFELLSVKMTETGPDMDEVERLVKDPTVKGIWCVPKYSNPILTKRYDALLKWSVQLPISVLCGITHMLCMILERKEISFSIYLPRLKNMATLIGYFISPQPQR